MALFPILTADGDTMVTADGFAIVIEGSATPTTGVLLIPTDGAAPSAVTISETTGLITGMPSLVPCEQGATLPDGSFALGNDTGGTGHIVAIDIYTVNFTHVISVPVAHANLLSPLVSNHHDAFYAATNTLGYDIVKLRASDGAILDTWLAIDTGSRMQAMVVSSDDAILYYTKNALNTPIHRYDLVGRAPLSDLVGTIGSQSGTYAVWLDASAQFLIVVKPTGGGGSLGNWAIERYDATSGTLLMTYPLGAAQDGNEDVCLGIDANDQTTFWVRSFVEPTGAMSDLIQYRVSDGAELARFTVTNFDLGGTVPSSCPLMVLSTDSPVPPIVATTYPIRRLRRFAL